MSFHGIFKKILNESTFAKSVDKAKSSVNEVAEDSAIGWLTRNNILPQVFGGEYNGLRVPSAVVPGKPVPVWSDRKYTTYPFVGINGYADFPAIEAKHGNEASFMSGKLKSINADINVRRILDAQVAAGTGIPGNVFLIFPQMPMSSVGTRRLNKSMSLFTTYNKRDSYSNGIYPYNVQQALSVDAEGKLHADPTKKGGVVLCPVARKAQMSSSGIMYADKLRMEDIYQMGYLYDRSIFATQFTGSDRLDFLKPGGLLGSYMSGVRVENDLRGGNPKFFHFDEFAQSNGFVAEDGSIDFIAIRKWILEADSEEIATKLLIPYLLKSPMDMTYCWRLLTPNMYNSMKSDIAVYNALNGKGQFFEDNLEEIDSGLFEFEADDDAMDDDLAESFVLKFENPDDLQKMVSEASDDSEQIESNLGFRREVMAIFDYYMNKHASTVAIKPKEQGSPVLRDDGRIATKHSGIKRTFARIITKSTPLMDIDYKFCPKGVDGMTTSYSGVLDYSPLFSKFSDIVDKSMPQQFKYSRIVGYIISFEYDPAIEEAYRKVYGKGKTRSLGMLKYYMESPNSVKLREPTVFDVIYVKGGKYGNFLFSSYSKPMSKNVTPMGAEPPPEVVSNGLYADNMNGLHSVLVHDLERINIAGRYNTSVH